MRRTLLFLLVTALVAGSLAFVEEDAEVVVERGAVERLFLRWDPPDSGTNCGSNLYLSTVAGTDDVVCTQIYATAVENSFSTRGEETIRLDALADIEGVIALGPAVGVTHGVAVVDATVRITGITSDGSETLGTHTEELVVTPASTAADDVPIEFTMDVDDALDGIELDFVTISVSLDGPQVMPWDFNLNGESWFDVPALAEVEPTA